MENILDGAGVRGFLKTTIPKSELAIGLKVVNEFGDSESAKEWLSESNMSWDKLMQLRGYLEHLVDGVELEEI